MSAQRELPRVAWPGDLWRGAVRPATRRSRAGAGESCRGRPLRRHLPNRSTSDAAGHGPRVVGMSSAAQAVFSGRARLVSATAPYHVRSTWNASPPVSPMRRAQPPRSVLQPRVAALTTRTASRRPTAKSLLPGGMPRDAWRVPERPLLDQTPCGSRHPSGGKHRQRAARNSLRRDPSATRASTNPPNVTTSSP